MNTEQHHQDDRDEGADAGAGADTATGAETGRGSATRPETGAEGTIDAPVMDGATDHSETEVDPRKGQSDPALIRDIDAGKKTVNPYG
ncbi:hypothetical protein MUN78_13950 [Leucobacter allii]|uniref:Uncharacterized protein n=1 Tax=Leucobacter allii TaxID=2932247 RepID=A0ABY4FKB3_9MICO|nr:hypothetical protein [Leucobacter allii]UOQ56759.1 hypothetical protein MUN78_13950 [Leucobacter allii]